MHARFEEACHQCMCKLVRVHHRLDFTSNYTYISIPFRMLVVSNLFLTLNRPGIDDSCRTQLKLAPLEVVFVLSSSVNAL